MVQSDQNGIHDIIGRKKNQIKRLEYMRDDMCILLTIISVSHRINLFRYTVPNFPFLKISIFNRLGPNSACKLTNFRYKL